MIVLFIMEPSDYIVCMGDMVTSTRRSLRQSGVDFVRRKLNSARSGYAMVKYDDNIHYVPSVQRARTLFSLHRFSAKSY